MMALVEVIRTPQTTDEVYNGLMQYCRNIRKVPVTCKDTPGYVHSFPSSLRVTQIGFVQLHCKQIVSDSLEVGFSITDIIPLQVDAFLKGGYWDSGTWRSNGACAPYKFPSLVTLTGNLALA